MCTERESKAERTSDRERLAPDATAHLPSVFLLLQRQQPGVYLYFWPSACKEPAGCCAGHHQHHCVPDTVPPAASYMEYSSHRPCACRKGVSKGLLIFGALGNALPRCHCLCLSFSHYVAGALLEPSSTRRYCVFSAERPNTLFSALPPWGALRGPEPPLCADGQRGSLCWPCPVCPASVVVLLWSRMSRAKLADRQRETGQSGRQRLLHNITLLL